MVAFLSGAVLTAANLNSAFNALTIRTVTGTSDTLLNADNGGAVTYSNASATTSTIPPFSSVAYATGTKIVLVNLGAGVVTVTAGAGVTVNGATLTLAQNAGGTCIKTATNTWSFLPFSSGVGAANFSDTATGTYSTFKYLTFSASGTITVTTAGFADIVLVAGGGGGAGNSGGGGGGGVLQITNAYLPVGTLTCTVGAGGSGTAGAGGAGQATRIGDYYAVGGGASISDAVTNNFGGSGAGGRYNGSPATGQSGTPGQGNNGGNGASTGSGGGGGAGAVGSNGVGTAGGAGGAGVNITLAGTTPTGGYVAGNYQVGGGGGGYGSGSGGAASFGGGAGSTGATATAGAANKGGGGGTNGANGGSGIIIVRVAV